MLLLTAKLGLPHTASTGQGPPWAQGWPRQHPSFSLLSPEGPRAPSLLPPVLHSPSPSLEPAQGGLGHIAPPPQPGCPRSGAGKGIQSREGMEPTTMLFHQGKQSRLACAMPPTTGRCSGLAALRLGLRPCAGSRCSLVAVVGEGGHELWLASCGAKTGVSGAQSTPALPQGGGFTHGGVSP